MSTDFKNRVGVNSKLKIRPRWFMAISTGPTTTATFNALAEVSFLKKFLINDLFISI